MKLNLTKELAAMEQMTVGQLQDRYVEVFGEAVRSRHRHYLIRRVAWRLQANAEGGLSERALRRAEELGDDADVRTMPPRAAKGAAPAPPGKTTVVRVAVAADPRLAIQPGVLCGLTSKQGFRDRGLLARFAYSLPTSKVGYRKLNPTSISQKAREQYRRLVRSALLLSPAFSVNGGPTPIVLRVAPDANSELDRFRARIEVQLREGGQLWALRDWGGKLVGLVCRIAGIFHGLQYSNSGRLAATPIDSETMLGAIAIGEYLIPHAQAAFYVMDANPAMGLARRILAWLEKEAVKAFSRRDAFLRLRGAVHRVEELNEPLRVLCDHGYIREIQCDRPGPGRKPSTTYQVNPFIYAQNTQNAQSIGSMGDCAHSVHCAREEDGAR